MIDLLLDRANIVVELLQLLFYVFDQLVIDKEVDEVSHVADGLILCEVEVKLLGAFHVVEVFASFLCYFHVFTLEHVDQLLILIITKRHKQVNASQWR